MAALDGIIRLAQRGKELCNYFRRPVLRATAVSPNTLGGRRRGVPLCDPDSQRKIKALFPFSDNLRECAISLTLRVTMTIASPNLATPEALTNSSWPPIAPPADDT